MNDLEIMKKEYENYKLLADQGDSVAMYKIGVCYHYGKGVDKDLKEAFKYYKLAARQLNLEPCGEIESDFLDFSKDFLTEHVLNECIDFIRFLVKQNYPASKYILGLCYYNGIGIKKNYKKAFKCFKLSAKEDHLSEAIFKLGVCYEKGIGTLTNYKKAIMYFKSSLENIIKKEENSIDDFCKKELNLIYKVRDILY